MHRIRLAHWHNNRPPGSETDVDDEQLAALTRDGRVAEVLGTATEQQSDTGGDTEQQDQAVAEPEPADAGPEPSAKTSRRRR